MLLNCIPETLLEFLQSALEIFQDILDLEIKMHWKLTNVNCGMNQGGYYMIICHSVSVICVVLAIRMKYSEMVIAIHVLFFFRIRYDRPKGIYIQYLFIQCFLGKFICFDF